MKKILLFLLLALLLFSSLAFSAIRKNPDKSVSIYVINKSQGITISKNENIGINQTNPTQRLDVSGSVNINNNLTVNTTTISDGRFLISEGTAPPKFSTIEDRTTGMSIDGSGGLRAVYFYVINSPRFGITSSPEAVLGSTTRLGWGQHAGVTGGSFSVDVGFSRSALGVLKLDDGSTGFGSLLSGATSITGEADEVQLLVKGNSVQNSDVFQITDSSDNSLLTVDNNALMTVFGDVIVSNNLTVSQNATVDALILINKTVTPSAVEGKVFYNSTNNKAWIYNGTVWEALN